MKISLGFINIYITRHRMKRRGTLDNLRRNHRRELNRVKSRMYRSSKGRCFVCGCHFKEDELHIHHVLPVSEHPELITQESNLRLMCAECHALIHSGRKEVTL